MAGKNLAFIVGQYKSGSTWLINILSGHPWIRGLSETHVFRYSQTQDFQASTCKLFTKTAWSEGGLRNLPRHRLGLWSWPVRKLWRKGVCTEDRPGTLLDLSIFDQFALRRTLLQSNSKEDYCQRFFQFSYSRLQPQRYLIEKTPNNILHVPYIKSIFPDSKLILIYRDGRDVVVSDSFFKSNIIKKGWSFKDSVCNWRHLTEHQLKYTEKFGIFTCSYESLLQVPETVVRKILDFLEIQSDTSIIQHILSLSSFEFITGRSSGEENQQSFYRKGIRGDWVNHFTEKEKNIFKELAGELLIRLGYEKDNSW